ncbi:MAG: cupin domain-containing protein [Rubrivivax sp.]|nr:cupin domain-containing protein [Rubrivivax sp.]
MNAVPDLLLPPSLHPAPGVYAYDLEALPWRTTPRGHVREKAVRREDSSGRFLGLLAFEPLSRSGLHQHLATATSYFLAGSLTDYQGTTAEGEVGINLAGATHDAVSYGGCTLVSRLEGPVVIPNDALAIHPHADQAVVRNQRPGTPPDISVNLARAVPVATAFAGVVRKPLFDYAGTGTDRRLCALTLWPRCPALALQHTALTDFFVLAGDLKIGAHSISGPAFVLIEPGARVSLSSDHGCSLLAWAEGPGWSEATEGAELYGF